MNNPEHNERGRLGDDDDEDAAAADEDMKSL